MLFGVALPPSMLVVGTGALRVVIPSLKRDVILSLLRMCLRRNKTPPKASKPITTKMMMSIMIHFQCVDHQEEDAADVGVAWPLPPLLPVLLPAAFVAAPAACVVEVVGVADEVLDAEREAAAATPPSAQLLVYHVAIWVRSEPEHAVPQMPAGLVLS